MASTIYEHIYKDGHKVQVDSAIRDGSGKNIASTYATKSEVAGKQNIVIVDADLSSSEFTPVKGYYRHMRSGEGFTPFEVGNTYDAIYWGTSFDTPTMVQKLAALVGSGGDYTLILTGELLSTGRYVNAMIVSLGGGLYALEVDVASNAYIPFISAEFGPYPEGWSQTFIDAINSAISNAGGFRVTYVVDQDFMAASPVIPFINGMIYYYDGTSYKTLLPEESSWGKIGGSLSSQTDLKQALDAKQPLVFEDRDLNSYSPSYSDTQGKYFKHTGIGKAEQFKVDDYFSFGTYLFDTSVTPVLDAYSYDADLIRWSSTYWSSRISVVNLESNNLGYGYALLLYSDYYSDPIPLYIDGAYSTYKSNQWLLDDSRISNIPSGNITYVDSNQYVYYSGELQNYSWGRYFRQAYGSSAPKYVRNGFYFHGYDSMYHYLNTDSYDELSNVPILKTDLDKGMPVSGDYYVHTGDGSALPRTTLYTGSYLNSLYFDTRVSGNNIVNRILKAIIAPGSSSTTVDLIKVRMGDQITSPEVSVLAVNYDGTYYTLTCPYLNKVLIYNTGYGYYTWDTSAMNSDGGVDIYTGDEPLYCKISYLYNANDYSLIRSFTSLSTCISKLAKGVLYYCDRTDNRLVALTGGGGKWGDISGSISNQPDLVQYIIANSGTEYIEDLV